MIYEWAIGAGEHFLHHMIANEGIPPHGPRCQLCTNSKLLYRCRDCQHGRLECAECLKLSHRNFPTHRIRRWNERYFEDDTLRAAGCVLDLGHDGCPCDLGQIKEFVLVDLTGIHRISVRFCKHKGSGGHARQLFRARIFPASEDIPATGFTFGLLKHFSLLSSIAKVSAEGFYNVLVAQTSPCFPTTVPDRYREFMRVAREWQFLNDLKRAGETSFSVRDNIRGDLALRCPACPRPLINYDPALVVASIRWVRHFLT